MKQNTFKALIVEQNNGRQTNVSIREIGFDSLPAGDVLVSVAYSSLNYKDGLAVTGQGKVLRSYPIVPGIDLAGTVIESSAPAFKPGDQVLVTGYEIGEKYWGGYSQMARVKSEWLVPLPRGLDLKQAVAIGTAGFTAMLAVMALEDHGLTPQDRREVVVTGATGGLGSMAVAILARLGYNVVASTGRAETHDYLKILGAANLIERRVLGTSSSKALESERWAGAVDSIGGETLASLLRTMVRGGSVAACGNAGGVNLRTTVFPFILRGVNLLGIDSNLCPMARRREAWRRLERDLPRKVFDMMIQTISLEEVPAFSHEILQGKIRGRVVIDLGRE